MRFKDLIRVTGALIVVASLCCLSPLILVLFGLSTATFAGSLADSLYGDYKWIFRVAGLVLLIASVTLYLRRTKGICTIDEAKRRRREITNTIIIVLIVGVIGYIIFLYVLVEYVGVLLKIWK